MADVNRHKVDRELLPLLEDCLAYLNPEWVSRANSRSNPKPMRHQCLQARHVTGASSTNKCNGKWYTLARHSSKRATDNTIASWAITRIASRIRCDSTPNLRVALPNPARLKLVPP